jgi:hypothetical protein
MPRIAALFEDYRAGLIPERAGSVQVEACREAFWGGAYSVLLALREDAADERRTTLTAALAALEAECDAFARTRLGAGHTETTACR